MIKQLKLRDFLGGRLWPVLDLQQPDMPVERIPVQVQQRGNLPIGHALSVEGCNRLLLGHADLVRHRRLHLGKTSAYDSRTLPSHWPVLRRPSLVLFQASNDNVTETSPNRPTDRAPPTPNRSQRIPVAPFHRSSRDT
jgi:hypothetical protein